MLVSHSTPISKIDRYRRCPSLRSLVNHLIVAPPVLGCHGKFWQQARYLHIHQNTTSPCRQTQLLLKNPRIYRENHNDIYPVVLQYHHRDIDVPLFPQDHQIICTLGLIFTRYPHRKGRRSVCRKATCWINI
jgi:hypothetical protein